MLLFGALVLGENVGIQRLYIIPIKQNSDPTQELTDSLFSQVLEYIFQVFLSQNVQNTSLWSLQSSVLTT